MAENVQLEGEKIIDKYSESFLFMLADNHWIEFPRDFLEIGSQEHVR